MTKPVNDEITVTDFDIAAHLRSPAEIAAFLTAASESGEARELAYALGIVARAQNQTQLAAQIGMTRQGLAKADTNPKLDTVTRLSTALGLKIVFVPSEAGARRP